MSGQRNKPKDSNQSSKLLSTAENNTVFDVLGQRRVTKATAVVQIYFANQSPSQWAKQHTGILCFVKDNVKRSYYLRMIDISRRSILWEHELYYQISYVQDRKQFHSFAGQDYMIGFNFADAEESHLFYEAVQVKIDEYKKKLSTKNTPATRPSGDSGISGPSQIGSNGGGGMGGGSGFGQALTSFDSRNNDKKQKKKEKKLTKEDISAPSNFKHLAHVGWNSQAGSFEWNNIQDERWKNLFTEVAGLIGQSDLDKEQVQLIYDMVEKKGGIEAAHRDIVERRNTIRDTHPPPPPTGKGRFAKDQLPPPPPPGGRRGNMPPPPPRGVDAPPIPENHPSQRGARGPPPPSNSKIPSPPPDMPVDFQIGAKPGGSAAPTKKSLPTSGGGGPPTSGGGGPPAPPPSSSKPGIGNLLDSIQSFDKEKLVRREESLKPQASTTDDGGIIGALANALLNRNKVIHCSDSSDDGDTDTDDDEW